MSLRKGIGFCQQTERTVTLFLLILTSMLKYCYEKIIKDWSRLLKNDLWEDKKKFNTRVLKE